MDKAIQDLLACAQTIKREGAESDSYRYDGPVIRQDGSYCLFRVLENRKVLDDFEMKGIITAYFRGCRHAGLF
jgi:hypothetical protein